MEKVIENFVALFFLNTTIDSAFIYLFITTLQTCVTRNSPPCVSLQEKYPEVKVHEKRYLCSGGKLQ